MGGRVEGETAIFHQPGKPDIIIPWNRVKAVLPLFPADNLLPSNEQLREALLILEANRTEWPKRPEVSEPALTKWRERIEEIRKRQEDEIQRAVREKVEAEKALIMAEKKQKTEQLEEIIKKYKGLLTRQQIEDALQKSAAWAKDSNEIIPDLDYAVEYWSRCLALPSDVKMPGALEVQSKAEKWLLDPSIVGTIFKSFVWSLFFGPILLCFHGLTRLLDSLRQRMWFGAGVWMGTALLAGTCFCFLFFYKPKTMPSLTALLSPETREAWIALENVHSKQVTRFAETFEVPASIFLHEAINRFQNPDPSSSAWVPMLSRGSTFEEKSGLGLEIKIPLIWVSLPVQTTFANPSQNRELSLQVTGGKIGAFPVGAAVGSWIWREVAPVYQAAVGGLGLDQGVRIVFQAPDKLAISIPEILAKQ